MHLCAYFGYPSQKCEWKALSVLLILSHLVVLHHGWIVYFVYQEGMSNDFPRVYGRSASRRQVSPEEHLTASADRSPQDSIRLIDMSGNEQSLLSSLPFNCMKCVHEMTKFPKHFFRYLIYKFNYLVLSHLLTNTCPWLLKLLILMLLLEDKLHAHQWGISLSIFSLSLSLSRYIYIS